MDLSVLQYEVVDSVAVIHMSHNGNVSLPLTLILN